MLIDATLRVIPRSEFLNLLGQSAQFDLEVLQRVSARLLHLEQKFASFSEKPASDRLAETLLSFAERYGRPISTSGADPEEPDEEDSDYVEITLPLTNLQLAERVGVTPETLSALLASLKEQSIVKRKGRRFVVQRKKLRTLCHA